MKNLTFILLALLLSLPVVARKPYILESHIIDYRDYTSRGFFITETNSVSFDYDAIGSIIVTVEEGYHITEAKKEKPRIKERLHGVRKGDIEPKYGEFIKANIYDALDELYSEAIAAGANGVISLRIETIYTHKDGVPVVTGYVVRGMAINKK